MYLSWVNGILFRPAATFEWSRDHVRFGYWWIVLSVMTLNAVVAVYRPLPTGSPSIPAGYAVLYVTLALLILLDIQALLLLGAARLFRWRLTWPEALKYMGMAWSVHLLESLITFPLAVKGQTMALLWIGLPFFIWYMVALTAGVIRLAGLSLGRALLLSLAATVPWQIAIYWFTLQSINVA